MALFEGLLGGGGGSPLDLYGDLFTPEQKAALQNRELSQGLFRMAEKLGAAAMPSRVPVSPLAALGQGLGAFGQGSDITEQALKGMQVAEQVRESQRKRAALNSYQAIIEQGLRATGIDPKSPQGQQIVQQTLASQGAPAAPGAPTGGPLAGNAPPPPPPIGSAPGLPADIGNIAGPASWLPGTVPPAMPIPPAPPGGRITPADYGVTNPSQTGLLPGQQNTSLLPLPPGAAPGAGVLSASLYGGSPNGAGPFAPASLPGAAGATPDLSNINIEQLSGEAAPAGADVPFPTTANPNKPKSAWEQGVTYDAPSRPYDPSVDRPANAVVGPEERGLLARAKAPDTVIPPPRDNRSTLLDEIANRESGNRNIMQQLVPTTQSTAQGPWQITNETWRDIAPKVGIDTEKYPNAMSVPVEVQRVVADRLLQERGTRPWKAMRVADTGGGPLANPPGAGAALATPSGGGVIPGINMTPTQLGLLNALGKIGGLDSPFSSLLETYYKSPGYLGEKARTEAQAQKDVALKMDPLIEEQNKRAAAKVELEYKPQIEEAVQKLQSPILKERAQAQADIDRISAELKINQTAAVTPTDATIVGPGGALIDTKIPALELALRQQERARRIASGDTTIRPGDIVGKPVGAAPAEHQYIMTPQGTLSAVPVPGTPAAEKAMDVANKKLQTEQAKLISRDTVVREVDNIGKLMESATLPTTGFGGSLLQNLGGTAANNIRIARQTLESRLSADALNAQRAASPTGAAFGNTSDTDVALLRTALVNLDQSQTKEQFQERLQILKQAYVDAVHGPGMSRLLPETPVLKTPTHEGSSAHEIIQNGWRYDATTHKPIGPAQ